MIVCTMRRGGGGGKVAVPGMKCHAVTYGSKLSLHVVGVLLVLDVA